MAPCDGGRFASWSGRSDGRLRGRADHPPLSGRIAGARDPTGEEVRWTRASVESEPSKPVVVRAAPLSAAIAGSLGSPHPGLAALDWNSPRLRTERAAGTPGINDRTPIRQIADGFGSDCYGPHGYGPDSSSWPSAGGARVRHCPFYHPIRPPACARPLWAGVARRAAAPEF